MTGLAGGRGGGLEGSRLGKSVLQISFMISPCSIPIHVRIFNNTAHYSRLVVRNQCENRFIFPKIMHKIKVLGAGKITVFFLSRFYVLLFMKKIKSGISLNKLFT
jgi:hypothetical protein